MLTRTGAFAAYLLFVVYGSLVPLDYRPGPIDEAWQRFLQTPFLNLDVGARADWVANGVLYLPLGALAVRCLRVVAPWPVAMALGWVLCALVALGVEFAQLFFPPRTVSQNDLLAEGLGAAVGALVAPRVSAWTEALAQAWGRDARRLARLAFLGYGAAYLLYAFFPFDLLLSRAELAGKLATGHWGWLLASPTEGSMARRWLQLLAECVLTVPVGLALAGRSPWRAAGVGAALGLLIELGQIFIATGVSQGASVVSRALGVALGAALAARQPTWAGVRAWIHGRRHVLLPSYLALLPLVGWGRHTWGGWDRAWQSWAELRWLPFYYHYYTSEAAALASLGATVVMYLPVAGLGWAGHLSARAATLIAALLAAVIEGGRLFMADTHPDPTNLLIAAATVFGAMRLLRAIEDHRRGVARPATARPSVPAGRVQPEEGPAEAPAAAHPRTLGQRLLAREAAWVWPVWLAAGLAAAGWPAAPAWILAVLAVSAIAVTWLPALALVIVPMAMPVFDLAPWSGRTFVDEFDLLCAVALSAALAHTPRPRRAAAGGLGIAALPFAAFGLCLVVGAVMPLLSGAKIDVDSFSNPHSPFNGLRILKGALWAWLFATVYSRQVGMRPSLARWFHAGLVGGLAMSVAVVLWERAAFTPLFDFGADFRVTGPFSVMNKGGAYVEAFLVVGAAFLAAEAVAWRGRRMFWAAALLLALTSFSVLVTYSRNGYAALVMALLVVAASAFRARGPAGGRRARVAMLLALAVLAALPVLMGPYARDRLAQTARDFEVRVRHWQVALDLRDATPGAIALGTGLGRLPERHAWGRHEEVRAAGFRLQRADGRAHLRLGTGAKVYVEQVVSPPAGVALNVSARLRSGTEAAPVLALTLCRKWMLTSTDCRSTSLRGTSAPGAWQSVQATLAPLPEPARPAAAWLPVKLSLLTPGAAAIDVDDLRLIAPGPTDRLRNGSFEQGMDRWFFATDVDPPWHIHSLPVALLFDLGWIGLVAAAAMLMVAAVGAARALVRGGPPGVAASGALAAFLVSGALNTLIDEPRFLWLFLMLAWLCAFHGQPERGGMRSTAAEIPRSPA